MYLILNGGKNGNEGRISAMPAFSDMILGVDFYMVLLSSPVQFYQCSQSTVLSTLYQCRK